MTEKVQLVYAYLTTGRYHRLQGEIEVDAIAYEKRVQVVWYTKFGQYAADAHYVRATRQGREVWSFSVDTAEDVQFDVVYEVDGEIYTDNRQGRHYDVHAGHPSTSVILGSPPVKVNEWLYHVPGVVPQPILDADGFRASILVDAGSASEKGSVFMRYTTDGWDSYAETEATHHVSTDSSCSPPAFKVFHVNLSLPETVSRLDYAIRYEDDTRVYWDAHSGANYVTVR
ncbi:hypothetical protein [Marinicrinis sediminis]|uniref:CBM21 domain-containing protein n=1 Tax=Marinicrinis sediminis TaxID=1652465 RepID=A0ABW5RB20_9BACL